MHGFASIAVILANRMTGTHSADRWKRRI